MGVGPRGHGCDKREAVPACAAGGLTRECHCGAIIYIIKGGV